LENLAYAFTHPSILDVKLGTIMYAPDAHPTKKAKMINRDRTSSESGMRFTGCQVCFLIPPMKRIDIY